MVISFKTLSNFKYFVFFVLFIGSFAFGLDKSKYISVDEVKRGMDAYCLTVLEGSEPKKYPLKVVSVVYNQKPGLDGILVVGTDEAFKHIGPVQGCSGSPVYIDGRMAGALAAGWSFSVDPLYMVTPIEEMLRVGSVVDSSAVVSSKNVNASMIDFSKPLDLAFARDRVFGSLAKAQNTAGGFNALPCPLVTSFSPEVCQSLAGDLKATGLVPLAGGGTDSGDESGEDVKYVPGGVLAIPLVSGDISMAGFGTVTEVVGDKVYGFGHSFLGQGAVDLPMAAGKVHTVVSNMNFSFKLATAGKISGAFRADESTAIFGRTGAKARLIPLRVKVSRFDAVEDKVFNCKMAYHRLYTPMLLQAVLAGAAQMQGALPEEHTVEYKAGIGVKGFDPIKFENVSSGSSINDVVGEAVGAVTLLMNNSFGDAEIDSLDFEINIKPDNMIANFSSIELDDVKVKPGGKVGATVVLQSYKSEKTAYRLSLDIPKDLKPGKYKIVVTGDSG
ncbi:MAG: hypothetical protein K9M75_04075, partial [Phycisphaerae bacterium]|nr:hypothetical protein [Phycisphaerae bacterium]